MSKLIKMNDLGKYVDILNKDLTKNFKKIMIREFSQNVTDVIEYYYGDYAPIYYDRKGRLVYIYGFDDYYDNSIEFGMGEEWMPSGLYEDNEFIFDMFMKGYHGAAKHRTRPNPNTKINKFIKEFQNNYEEYANEALSMCSDIT